MEEMRQTMGADGSFDAVPSRIFLDTSTVNKIVEFGEYFFDNFLQGEALRDYVHRPPEDQEDIEALHDTLCVYKRICMPLYISETTMHELEETPGGAKRSNLLSYAWAVLEHWREWGAEEVRSQFDATAFESSVKKAMAKLESLKDTGDRRLVAEAIVMGCQVFLTMDRRSLWARCDQLNLPSLRVLRPVELWSELAPWVRLWY